MEDRRRSTCSRSLSRASGSSAGSTIDIMASGSIIRDDIYKAGDTASNSFRFVGRTTIAGTDFYATLFLDKPIAATSFSFSNLSGHVYLADGSDITLGSNPAIGNKAIRRNQAICSISLPSTQASSMMGYAELSGTIIFS